MPVHPAPPYPKAPPPVGLNRSRLWFLCLAAGFTRAQISALTGVPARAICELQARMRIWRGDFESLAQHATDRQVLVATCEHLGVPATRDQIGRGDGALRRHLRDAFVAGRIEWAAVDRLPHAEDLVAAVPDLRRRRPGTSRTTPA